MNLSEKLKRFGNAERIAAIMAVDKHPYFAEYKIGEEGFSNGHLDGVPIKKYWDKHSIRAIINEFFNTARRSIVPLKSTHKGAAIGEMVGGYTTTLGGRETAFGIAYYPPGPEREAAIKSRRDVASIEGDVDFDLVTKSIKAFKKFIALAVGDSEIETPGFAGAVMTGSIQMFASAADKVTNDTPPSFYLNPETNRGNKMTLQEIKDFIRENQTSAKALYSVDQIKEAFPDIAAGNHERITAALNDEKKKAADAETRLAEIAKERDELKKVVDAATFKQNKSATMDKAFGKYTLTDDIKGKVVAFLDELEPVFANTPADKLPVLIEEKIEKAIKVFGGEKAAVTPDENKPIPEPKPAGEKKNFYDPVHNPLI
jgi:hypothetical protein